MAEKLSGGWVGTVALPAFESLHEQFKQGGFANVDTKEFTLACAQLTDVFDRLGMALKLASQDVNEKKTHLLQEHVLENSPKVKDLISNDLPEDKICLTGEDSRMLHCLKRMLDFVSHLMDGLVKSPLESLYNCASETYTSTLAKYHTTAVRYVISGGLWLLPSRANFLVAINETEESLKEATGKWLLIVIPMLKELEEAFAPYENRCIK